VSTLIVIPARLASKRLPRKPLRLLGGRALIVRVWEHVSAMRMAARTVIATDSPEVAEVARAAGADVALTRTDHQSGTDRVAEVAAMPEYTGFDVIVNVQGDEPFVGADAIAGAASLVERGAYSLGTAASRAEAEILDNPDVVKVVTDRRGRALYFSRAPIPYLRDPASPEPRAARDDLVLRHLGVYAYTRDALAQWVALPPHPLEITERLEQLRPLANGIAMGVAIAAPSAPGIDTEADLTLANARWNASPQSPPLTPPAPDRSPAAAGQR
jgi:3-deoxy-manno-octulosonate cytidylyltransferase (CMP-KDO synthetase)